MLKEEEFKELRDFIYERTGIYFSENKMYLIENRLMNRLTELGLSSFSDYYLYLKSGEDRVKDELLNLYDAITTNETSFFRHPEQFDALRRIVINEYLKDGKDQFCGLRIWSAGCSTGDEPYTIAIVLMEIRETLKKNLIFSIYATDISPKVLESAKRGIYSEYNLRGVDENIKKRFFSMTKEKNYKIKEEVKRLVKFDFMNLLDEGAYKLYKNMDIIFCRNVLVYFDERAKKKVLGNFYECLKPGGYLILGYAETIHQRGYGFRPILFPGAVIYKKG